MSAGEFYQMVAGIGDGFLKGYKFGQNRYDRSRAREQEESLASLLSGMAGGTNVAPAMTPQAQSGVAAPAGAMGAFRNAISSIESGGNYGITGPVTKSGDRAYGKYQVMGANIPSWTREALGQSLTPQQFLASPEAQDKVFDHKFGQAVQKYGNPQDAASVWFTGRPLAQGAGSRDILGTSGQGYVNKFTAALGRSGASAQQAIGQAAPQQIAQAAPQTATDARPMQIPTMPQQRPGIDPRLLTGILNNPQSGQGAKLIAQTLLAKQFETKDPLAQQKMLLEIQRMQNDLQNAPLAQEKAQLEIQQMRAGMNKPNTEIIRDAATGEILSVDRNNPNGGVQVLRQAGPSKDAPTTRVIKQADGSEVAVQWDPIKRSWAPMEAPQGGAAVRAPSKLNEQQSKDIVYYNRGRQALEAMGTGEVLSGFWNTSAAKVPVVGNYATTEEFQVARQAARNFLMSILRKDTGAAITQGEEKLYGEIFLPQPGDKQKTLQLRAQARAQALDAIRDGLGPAEVLAIGERFVSRDRQGQKGQSAAPNAAAPSRLPAGKATTINGVKIERIE